MTACSSIGFGFAIPRKAKNATFFMFRREFIKISAYVLIGALLHFSCVLKHRLTEKKFQSLWPFSQEASVVWYLLTTERGYWKREDEIPYS